MRGPGLRNAMHFETNTKLITCILPKGKALPLQRALVDEKNIHAGNFHFGRGVGRDSHIRDRGIGEQQERELLEVVVPADQADELFEFMYLTAEMDQAHGGMIYITTMNRSTLMTLPDIPEEE